MPESSLVPELSQAELNQVVRALYVAREGRNLAKAATRTLEVLTAVAAKRKSGLEQDDPLLLATALLEEVDDKAYAARVAKLEAFACCLWIVVLCVKAVVT